MKKGMLCVTICIFGLLMVGDCIASPIQWGLADGGNDHWYDVISLSTSTDWDEANILASSYEYLGTYGHLATITSASENGFIVNNFASTLKHALGGFQSPGFTNPAEGWNWVTGETFSYTNWAPGEPNDAGGYNEIKLAFGNYTTGTWNDCGTVSGYVVEWDEYSQASAPVPEPSTILLFSSGLAGLAGIKRKLRKKLK